MPHEAPRTTAGCASSPPAAPAARCRPFAARHRDAGEAELRRILGDAIGAAYFFRRLGPHQTQAAAAITDLDFVEFRY
ncbi:hypothetical protein ACIOG8_31700 [Streptomyces erythrochromogenes]|uniref:hypothetical protein n=1 Tax=Streptomyces erythrochromogenes TaxID=285574 RepID=UPI00382265D8